MFIVNSSWFIVVTSSHEVLLPSCRAPRIHCNTYCMNHQEYIFVYEQDKGKRQPPIADLKAISRNRLNSGMLCPVLPSAIFNARESAALFICDERLYLSSTGNFLTSRSISLDKSAAICQTLNSSNLKAIV